MRDPWMFHALGIFSATFLYALVGLIFVDNYNVGRTPGVAVSIAILLFFISLIVFNGLIRRIGAMQINQVLRMIAQRGWQENESTFPPGKGEGTRPLPLLRYQGEPAVIVEIALPRLLRLAESLNGVIVLEYGVGDMLADGAELLYLHGGHRKIDALQLRGCLTTGPEHTIKQDPKFAIRLIVDIAIRALLPAINDPTTAVQSMGLLEDLLRRNSVRRLATGMAYDLSGSLRLIYPTPTWDDIFLLAIDEIRYYGATSLQVMRRLRALLGDLSETVSASRHNAVMLQLKRVDASIARSFVNIEDRRDACGPTGKESA